MHTRSPQTNTVYTSSSSTARGSCEEHVDDTWNARCPRRSSLTTAQTTAGKRSGGTHPSTQAAAAADKRSSVRTWRQEHDPSPSSLRHRLDVAHHVHCCHTWSSTSQLHSRKRHAQSNSLLLTSTRSAHTGDQHLQVLRYLIPLAAPALPSAAKHASPMRQHLLARIRPI